MEFRIIDCQTSHEKEDDEEEEEEMGPRACNERFVIQLFGIDEARNTYSVTVTDFKPMFYVLIPETFNSEKRRQFTAHLREKMGAYFEPSMVEVGVVNRAKLYGFDARTQHRFMYFKFTNMAAFHRVKNLWFKEVATSQESRYNKKAGLKWSLNPKGYLFKGHWLELYEANIPPALRFFHIRDISPTGWVRVNKGTTVHQKMTTCHFEVRCSAADIDPLAKDTIVPLKICSFDIEASSSHGDFPLAVKDYKKLAQSIVEHVDAAMKPSENMVHRCVRTAFGYDDLDNVDSVYPKKPIEGCDVDDLIEEWAVSDLPKHIDPETVAGCYEQDKEKEKDKDLDKDLDKDDDDSTEDEAESDGSSDGMLLELPKGKTLMALILDKTFDKVAKVAVITQTLGYIFPPLEGDRVTYIGSTFKHYGTSKPYLNHCINVGPSAPLDGVTMVHCADERDLLLEWTKLIQQEDPDVIIGYNIFSFDESFLFLRSLETGCVKEFLQLGRNKNVLAGHKNKEGKWELDEKVLMVASGEYNMRYFHLEGRIHMDPYVMFRKEYNLDSYKLDSVAATFIRDKISKLELTDENTTMVYSNNLKGLEVGNYVVFEKFTHSSTFLSNGRKHRVLSISGKYFVVEHRILHVMDAASVLSWCLAKDDVDHHDIFRMADGTMEERATIAAYCVQDCNLVHHLVEKVDMMTSCIEMANVCSVPIDVIVFRGQGAKLTSLISKKCKENGILMPVLPSSEFDTGYEGAIVLQPKCGIYERPVAVNDFSSLYPSVMISDNYSSDALVWFEEVDLEGNVVVRRNPAQMRYDNLEGYTYVDRSYDVFKEVRKTPKAKAEKVKCGEVRCRWAQFPDNQLGIMPSVLRELLKQRKETRKKSETEADPFMRGVLDKRQLAYKMTANSIYGQCGAKTSTFYNKHVAACCTAGGRAMIIYAKTVVEEVYCNLEYDTESLGRVTVTAEHVYGDTDSVFFQFYIRKDGVEIVGRDALAATIEISQDVGKVASHFLKPPHDWVYEKTFYPFVLLKKKGYVGMLYETDLTKAKRKSMGIVLKRRDNAPIVKDVYGGIIDIFMQGKSVDSAVQFIITELSSIYLNRYTEDKFVVTKSLRSGYKKPQQIAHKVLADRIGQRDPGNRPRAGDRISYVYVVTAKRKKGEKELQGNKIETPEYMKEQKLKIDYNHYVSNQIMKPVLQLLALVLEKLPGFKPFQFKREIDGWKSKIPDPEKYQKKVEMLRQREVKTLVFDRFLTAN